VNVVDKTLHYHDFEKQIDLFATGNYSKGRSVTRRRPFLPFGPLYTKARELYLAFRTYMIAERGLKSSMNAPQLEFGARGGSLIPTSRVQWVNQRPLPQ